MEVELVSDHTDLSLHIIHNNAPAIHHYRTPSRLPFTQDQ